MPCHLDPVKAVKVMVPFRFMQLTYLHTKEGKNDNSFSITSAKYKLRCCKVMRILIVMKNFRLTLQLNVSQRQNHQFLTINEI